MSETSEIPAPNRRRHERFKLQPMYTSVAVQRVEQKDHRFNIEQMMGHAYDLSESGARIEVDEPLNVGEQLAMSVSLPGEQRGIYMSAEVVRVYEEEDDPGPRRAGVQFMDFLSPHDRQRLMEYIGDDVIRQAA